VKKVTEKGKRKVRGSYPVEAGENASEKLNELRKKVENDLLDINDIMTKDINVDINVYDTIRDLSDKLKNMLYCEKGEYCKIPDALIWALDFTDDIQRIAGYAKMIDVYSKAAQIANEIRRFYYG